MYVITNVDAALDVGGGRDGVGAVVRNDRVFLSLLQVCALLVRLMLRLLKQLLSIKLGSKGITIDFHISESDAYFVPFMK
ncbi:hypothetical protein QYF36_000117 [Acer negundo]|nr:hypothetical protein QYF36_000117 [Acer negundo]